MLIPVRMIAHMSAHRLLPLLLGAMLTLPGCAGGPAVAPPGDRPLIVSDRGGAVRVYEIDASSGTTRLVGSPSAGDAAYQDSMPARLPGGRIVLVSDRGGHPALYLLAAGHGDQGDNAAAAPLLPDDGAADSDPAPLGPDRIVFARAASAPPPPPGTASPRDLFSVGLDGTGLRRLTGHPADDGAPCVLPDGRTIIFISNRSGPPRLFRLDAAAADPETTVTEMPAITVTAPPGTSVLAGAPACMPDGSVVFARTVAGQPSQLCLLAAGAVRQITEPAVLPYGAFDPVVLSGGAILMTAGPGPLPKGADHGPRFAVYRIEAGGYNLVRVTRERVDYDDLTRRRGSGR
jgi:hypothetical protein